jgi:hypothetical protein
MFDDEDGAAAMAPLPFRMIEWTRGIAGWRRWSAAVRSPGHPA